MNELKKIIYDEMVKPGVLPFHRFMELALYCPLYGFYEQERDTIGQRGHFYTSVSAGNLFGELLAFQFAEWLAELGTRNTARGTSGLQIVEAGAHDGRLAKDILDWFRSHRPQLMEQIEYWIIEPSARRQEWQNETLKDFAPRARWFGDLEAVKLTARKAEVTGIIFSNELLDAMPVHRLGWDASRREWFEWGVASAGGGFVWRRMPELIRNPRLTIHVPSELLDVLPDGFTTEVCPAAEQWWREAAGLLEHGKLLTIDYGLNAEEFFAPQRAQGTLRSYRHHRQTDDVLADPGEQDITAHVNFSALQSAGEAAGSKTEILCSQSQFLTRIAERLWKTSGDAGAWKPEQTRQFQTLIHPDHLGRAFRVLVQKKI